MRLFLVRHGQTSWNIAGRAQGHTDIPLDDTGLEQAARVGQSFEGVRLDRIFCSDLVRASQTAEPIAAATGAPIEFRKDLRERAFGEWEGTPFVDVHARINRATQDGHTRWVEVRPPGGESFVDVWDRTATFVADIRSCDETVAVVSHGGTLSLILARLIHGTPETSRSFRMGNTSVFELERRQDGFFHILRFNDTCHLDSGRAVSLENAR